MGGEGKRIEKGGRRKDSRREERGRGEMRKEKRLKEGGRGKRWGKEGNVGKRREA